MPGWGEVVVCLMGDYITVTPSEAGPSGLLVLGDFSALETPLGLLAHQRMAAHHYCVVSLLSG